MHVPLLNFDILGFFQKKECFGGFKIFVDIFFLEGGWGGGVTTKLDSFFGSFL